MSEPLLTRYDAPGRPDAMILMLHGGKPRSRQSVDGRSASWRRAAVDAAHDRDAGRTRPASGVWLVRYRERGWNGGADRVADARWALDRVRAEHGDVPVVLLGPLDGRPGGRPRRRRPVGGGRGRAGPWWSAEDPVSRARRPLAGGRARAPRPDHVVRRDRAATSSGPGASPPTRRCTTWARWGTTCSPAWSAGTTWRSTPRCACSPRLAAGSWGRARRRTADRRPFRPKLPRSGLLRGGRRPCRRGAAPAAPSRATPRPGRRTA